MTNMNGSILNTLPKEMIKHIASFSNTRTVANFKSTATMNNKEVRYTAAQIHEAAAMKGIDLLTIWRKGFRVECSDSDGNVESEVIPEIRVALDIPKIIKDLQRTKTDMSFKTKIGHMQLIIDRTVNEKKDVIHISLFKDLKITITKSHNHDDIDFEIKGFMYEPNSYEIQGALGVVLMFSKVLATKPTIGSGKILIYKGFSTTEKIFLKHFAKSLGLGVQKESFLGYTFNKSFLDNQKSSD